MSRFPMTLIHRYRWFALIVALPSLLTAIYVGFVQSDEYVSESRFVIKSPGQRPAQISTLANLIQTTGLSSGQEQATEVIDYMRSRMALDDLNRSGKVSAIYQRPGVDALSRYPAPWTPAARESLFDYYEKKISTGLDHESGLVVLKVKAFTANDAQFLNLQLLDLGERLVNSLNARARDKAIREAERRVSEAETRVRNARTALSAFRNAHQLVDPAKQTAGVFEIANKLISERAALQAQLELTLRTAPGNPSVEPLRARIRALEGEIVKQSSRAVGSPNAISSQLSGYENLNLEQEFSTQNFVAASAALESARSEAVRQQFYLERVVQPNLPDLPEYPNRLRVIITVFATLTCLYFIGWMFVVGVIEHAPEN